MKSRKLRLQRGWSFSVASVLSASAAAGVIASSTWRESQTAGRLAITAVVLLAVALAVGSGRLVAFTSLPLLGAGLITVVGVTGTLWVRALVVGVLWYLSAELGWEAIERRDGVRRTREFNSRRLDEVSYVVLMSMGVTGLAFALSAVAPLRTTVILGLALAALIAGVGGVTRRVRYPNASTDE